MSQPPKSRSDDPARDDPRGDTDKRIPRARTDETGRPREPRQPGMGEDEDKNYEPEKDRENLTR